MRTLSLALCAALLLASAGVAGARALEKGANIFAVQLTEGATDLVDLEDAGYLTSANFTTHPELGVQGQWWHFFKDDYALAVSGGVGFYSETDKPGDNAPSGSPDLKYTQSSWQLRVGGDRVGKVTDRFHVFAGPGIQIWSGKWKYDDGTTTFESKSTMRIALEGRIGVHAQMTPSFGMFGQLGHYFGRVSAKESGAQASWWASGHDGAAGVAFTF